MHEGIAERHDAALAREPQLDLVPLIPLLSDGEEMLAACLDEPDRPTERSGQEWNQDVFGVDDGLGAEPAADVLRDDADAVLRQFQIARDEPAEHLGRLRRRPHRELAELGVPARHEPARLYRHPGTPVQGEALVQDHVGLGERACRIADPLGEAGCHIAAGMNAWPVRLERVGHGDGRQGLVLDLQGIERVLGLHGARCHHESHGLTSVGDRLLGQDLRTRGRDQAFVRHQQWQAAERRHVGRHDDVDDSGTLTRSLAVDLDEARVSVRAAQDRNVERFRERHVGDVAPAAGDQPLVLAAAHARAEQALAHQKACRGLRLRCLQRVTSSP